MIHGLDLDELVGAFDALGLSTTNLNWVAGTIGGISRKQTDTWSEMGDDGLVYCSQDVKTLGRAIRLYHGEERGGFEDFAARGPYMFRWAVPEAGALLKRIMSYRTLSEYGAHLFANGARILSSLGRFEVCGKLTESGMVKVTARLEVADEKDVEKFAIPLRTAVTVMREAIYKEGPNAALAYWIVGNLRVLTEGKSIVLETCDKTPAKKMMEKER